MIPNVYPHFEDGAFITREIVKRYRPDLLNAYDAANPTGKYRPFIRYK